MIDDATISRLAHETGVPLEVAREVCVWVDGKDDAANPIGLARAACNARRVKMQQAQARTAAPARRPQRTGGYADPEIARAELAKIFALLEPRSGGAS